MNIFLKYILRLMYHFPLEKIIKIYNCLLGDFIICHMGKLI